MILSLSALFVLSLCLLVRHDKKEKVDLHLFVKFTYHILAIILKDFLKCIDNARPPEPRIQNTRRTLGRLQLHELQTCIESQVQYFIIQHQHYDHCRRHLSSPVKINTISREALYSVPSSSQYGYDLDILERRVWPLIRCI